MNKDKINKEKKEKAKNIAFKILHGVSYALSTCFIATCIVACASSSSKKSDNSPKSLIQYRIDGESESQSESESVSYPIYDDSNYTITLGSSQYGYTYNNLCELIIDNQYTYSNIHWDVGTHEPSNILIINLEYGDEVGIYIIDSNSDVKFGFLQSLTYEETEVFNGNNNWFLKYWVMDSVENVSYYFPSSFVITSDSTHYNDIKQAIELDIQANTIPESPTSDIFTAISDTITNFVIALNSGITAIVGLFWNSTSSALTPLGVLVTFVVAVAISYFLFRLIVGLIRLRV